MKRYFGRTVYLWILLVVSLVAGAAPLPQAEGPPPGLIIPHPLPPTSHWVDQMPEGEARKIIVRKCQVCHTLQRAIAFSRSKAQWKGVVDQMIFSRGAPVTPDEVPKIVDYMAKNFGPLATHPPASPADCPVQTNGSSTFRSSFRGQYSLWVSNTDGASVDVVDPVSKKVVQRIKCVSSPEAVVFSQDGNRAYITDTVEDDVAVLDMNTGRIIKKISTSQRPNWALITKDGKQLIVAIWPVGADDSRHGAIDIIDTSSLTLVRTIPTNGGIHDTWMSPNGKYFVAGSIAAKFLSAYDVQTDELMWSIPFEDSVATMAFESSLSPGSLGRVFVGIARFPGFVVVDFAKHEEVARIKFPGVKAGGFHGNDISPDGKTMWFAGQTRDADNNVYGFSLPDLKPLGYVHLADADQVGQPADEENTTNGHWLAISPDSQKVYVVQRKWDVLSVVDVKSMKEEARIPVGEGPLHVSVFSH